MPIRRRLATTLRAAARAFPVVVLTGPRRSGKTTLLLSLAPQASYVLAEDPEVIARLRADPRTFLDDAGPPLILDEIQNVPEVLGHIRARVDKAPRATGRYFLTGSQEASLMRGVTESLAGRAAILHLLPFSTREKRSVSPFTGGFPEALARPHAAAVWFASYVQTYIERDVRAVTGIRDLALFRRFMALVASRVGQVLNLTEFAAPLGVSVPTVSSWLSILEATGLVLRVPPFYENFGKRLIKSPRLYFTDTGLVCHLLGIRSVSELERSPFIGPIFESFVVSEIAKLQIDRGERPELYTFRDQQGLEVDLIVPIGPSRLALIEAKSSRTARPEMAGPLERLDRSMRGYETKRFVIHRPTGETRHLRALKEGTMAVDMATLLKVLTPSPTRRL